MIEGLVVAGVFFGACYVIGYFVYGG